MDPSPHPSSDAGQEVVISQGSGGKPRQLRNQTVLPSDATHEPRQTSRIVVTPHSQPPSTYIDYANAARNPWKGSKIATRQFRDLNPRGKPRTGRGTDGKAADSEYARWLDKLNKKSKARGDQVLTGDRISGYQDLVDALELEEDSSVTTKRAASVPTPPVTPPGPTVGISLSIVSRPGVRDQSEQRILHQALATSSLVFGQMPGTVTPSAAPGRSRRLFEL